MTNKRRILSVVMAVVLVASMMFAMSTTAFASAELPSVKVSVTYGNFDTAGNYTGNGFTNMDLNIPIENYEIPISSIDYYIADTEYWNLKSVYLPSTIADPMNGQASVADAIIAAVYENYGKYSDEGETIETVIGGWDALNSPNGGYISNILNYSLDYNPTTYFKGENGNRWGRSIGTGWNVAYKYANGSMIVPEVYTTNIPVTDGMEIIFDVSKYDMTWDTGEPWTEQ